MIGHFFGKTKLIFYNF